jgi:hypothetical protein
MIPGGDLPRILSSVPIKASPLQVEAAPLPIRCQEAASSQRESVVEMRQVYKSHSLAASNAAAGPGCRR